MKLSDVLARQETRTMFEAFVKWTFCDEYLDIWIRMGEYKVEISAEKRSLIAVEIWAQFLAPDANTPVAIPAKNQLSVQEGLLRGSTHLFDEICLLVEEMLDSDALLKFLNSRMYYDFKTTGNTESLDSLTIFPCRYPFARSRRMA
eukprot:TRINITY_DN2828_c0_g1_i2.p1 TRINITY_DN2828_c0_g1~~TRINITY_DN2828_c0_g1_i2.p1  ORF type:complete len:146 (-),score=13.58 TRINITY_DN2828_c0_g1_i2:223-660(-)